MELAHQRGLRRHPRARLPEVDGPAGGGDDPRARPVRPHLVGLARRSPQLEEARATSQMFHNRRYGKDLNWKSFSLPRRGGRPARNLSRRCPSSRASPARRRVAHLPGAAGGRLPRLPRLDPRDPGGRAPEPRSPVGVRLHPNLVNYGVNEQAMQQAAGSRPATGQLPAGDAHRRRLLPHPRGHRSRGVRHDPRVEMASRGKPVVAVPGAGTGARKWCFAESPDAYLPPYARGAEPGQLPRARWPTAMSKLYNEVAVEFWVEEQAGGKGALTFNLRRAGPGNDPDSTGSALRPRGGSAPGPPPRASRDPQPVEERFLLRTYPGRRGARRAREPLNADRRPLPAGRRQARGGEPGPARHRGRLRLRRGVALLGFASLPSVSTTGHWRPSSNRWRWIGGRRGLVRARTDPAQIGDTDHPGSPRAGGAAGAEHPVLHSSPRARPARPASAP